MDKKKKVQFSNIFTISLAYLDVIKRYGFLLDSEETLLALEHSFVTLMMDEEVEKLVLQLNEYDQTSFLHSLDVMILGGLVSRKGKNFNLDYMRGCLLHDVGKIKVPQYILQKESSLTDEEFGIVKKHPLDGYKMLTKLGFHDEAVLAQLHHERMNGEGYPNGFLASDLDEGVRLLTIIDNYSAISLKRSYKEAKTVEESIADLLKSDGILDMDLLQCFIGKLKIEKDRN